MRRTSTTISASSQVKKAAEELASANRERRLGQLRGQMRKQVCLEVYLGGEVLYAVSGKLTDFDANGVTVSYAKRSDEPTDVKRREIKIPIRFLMGAGL